MERQKVQKSGKSSTHNFIAEMKIAFYLTALLLICGLQLNAQILTDSNLPIVIINTDQQAQITNFSKTPGAMKIIYHGPGIRNSMADADDATALIYNGRIDIGIRGSSSQLLDKKQYSLTTLLADNTTSNNV